MEDNINELIESDFPNTFDYMKKISNNAYQVANTKRLIGGWAVRVFEKLIWIIHPPFGSVTDAEMKANHMLSCLYADYFDSLQKSLKELLEKHNFNFDNKYRMNLYPSNNFSKELSFLLPYFSSLSKENPLSVVTHRIADSKVRSCIVYDSHYLIDFFSSDSNIGEKFCIKQLLQSLIQFSDNSISEGDTEKIASAFVEKNIPDGNKGYTIEAINVDNPKFSDYTNYQEPSQIEISRVNSEISVFLNEKSVKPGEYEGEDAKKLNEFIFEFLYQRLEDEIKRYDESLLLYTYGQVELIEGKREKNRWQSGVDASKRTDYDFIGKNVEEIKKIASSSSSGKLIVEIYLKVNPTGHNTITSDSWSYLQAISIVLHETIVICEYIEYDIIPHKLIVNDDYSIQDVRGEELFDHEDFYRCKSEISSTVSSKNLLNKKESGKVESSADSDFLDMLHEINEAFLEQYEFSLKRFIPALESLGRMDLFDKSYFPLTIITEENIVAKLIQCFNDTVDETELKKIIRFISLDFNSYDSTTKLVPTNLLRRKERLNLCPLIHLKSGEYLYGNQMCLESSNLWLNSILSGDFPCFVNPESEIHKALKNIHAYLDTEVEKDSGEIAKKTLGENKAEINILNFQRISKSFPKRPPCGEIDLLAANEEKKMIFVIDAKNMNNRTRPYDISREVDKFFHTKKSYLVSLSRKEKFVEENIEEILKYFGIKNFEGWTVKKAFVTNKVYHSAFSKSEVDFILLQDLSAYLKSDVV